MRNILYAGNGIKRFTIRMLIYNSRKFIIRRQMKRESKL